ncbi:putative Ubiquitin carboxyl-terminal hydrolase [Monocercomonoides exilis]|uniref:putative Ubiquitin carboxyl-terminal hydrolase n=1 Tax=Monocercomonoides exilis TaxID=2049356 RepID=UPI00355AA43B|nr:putative Ubiquitin carboxyl-terminal hydrolase [Monocercomonoides exilis]|eukprot:MONOS_8104.1-p1 / transcript=MONOS_8104.1 / gene=MONOS_8104 / organism=Monocercomonoides_exilis_PA203 / gene_product=unspecified product / transcript_product=unspecified product / location=Mono_scaffold00296:30478-33004(+) / protein_length=787 / sequence_SO=supercontig / SO=protein_coding / is_pseudo=false
MDKLVAGFDAVAASTGASSPGMAGKEMMRSPSVSVSSSSSYLPSNIARFDSQRKLTLSHSRGNSEVELIQSHFIEDEESRKAILSLVAALCSGNEANTELLLHLLNETQTMNDKDTYPSFHFTPAELIAKSYKKEKKVEKSEEVKYRGIVNPGTLCSMNSLFVQLFMHTQPRSTLLLWEGEQFQGSALEKLARPSHADVLSEWQKSKETSTRPPDELEAKMAEMRLRSVTEEEKVQNSAVWRAVRYLFWELQDNPSRKEFIDAEQFLEVYLDQDRKQVVNGVHCDIHEFFMCLVDKVEMHLDAVAAPNFVRRFLKDRTMNLHVCRCGHERWHSDGFYALEVEVKGKKSLVESLVSILVGSKPLTGNRVKINDKFKFPNEEELDLEPFTWEAIQVREEKRSSMKRLSKADTAIMLEKIGRKENLKNLQVLHNNESKDKLRPESYNKYRLQGIINHSGTANAGYNISFAREKDAPHQLNEFNDDKAFGGSFLDDTALIDPEILKYKRLGLLSEADTVKPYSAYILIYERKQPVDDWSLQHQLLSQIPQAKLKEMTKCSHLFPTVSQAIGSFPLFTMHPPQPHPSPLKMRSPFNEDVFADSALTEHSPMKSSSDGMSSVDERVLVRQLGIVRDRQNFSNTFFTFVRRLFEQFGCEQYAEEEKAATTVTNPRLSSTGASSATSVSSLIETKLAGKSSSSSSLSASASLTLRVPNVPKADPTFSRDFMNFWVHFLHYSFSHSVHNAVFMQLNMELEQILVRSPDLSFKLIKHITTEFLSGEAKERDACLARK